MRCQFVIADHKECLTERGMNRGIGGREFCRRIPVFARQALGFFDRKTVNKNTVCMVHRQTCMCGRIFRINCARNGLLAIELGANEIEILCEQTADSPQSQRVLVDLTRNAIHAPGGDVFEFELDASDRHMLLNGIDYIDFTLQYAADIDSFVDEDRERRPWAYLPG